MNLKKYRVQNFRSVEDSTWIDCDSITTLVGINESGKSNLLLALWKLNPVFGGKIDVLHDMPAAKLSEFRLKPDEICFITAQFELTEEDNTRIQAELREEITIPRIEEITISRYYNEKYEIDFSDDFLAQIPKDTTESESNTSEVIALLEDAILKFMPKFVYYSNYGNLSSRIYLPHAIKWLNGEQVTGIVQSEEQVRTMRVLFDYVNLNPQEILDLGTAIAPESNYHRISKEEISQHQLKREERQLLLNSASSDLTTKFRNWWKQGTYNFRLEADGDFFSIYVSDDKRPEPVDLSLRSTGLQWFLSFFLVFLVESKKAHRNAIILLDEAGLTLHPNAQKDLTSFFDGLATENQLILTTHSPFIIDTNNIDRCRVVYSDEHGKTVVSSDLRASAKGRANSSIYAIYSALGLNATDILLQGCQPIVVEGASDQYYLTAIKNILIREQKIAPKQELVFIPSGGVRGIAEVSKLLSGKNDGLPFVILDSDSSGNAFAEKLKKELYKGAAENIVQIKDIVGFDGAEVEDLISVDKLNTLTQSLTRGCENEFMHAVNEPYLPQFQRYAEEEGIDLQQGWKVELARVFKTKSLQSNFSVEEKELEMWEKLFKRIIKL